MSVHDAVSCDACMKSSFSGNRYKCLICYDYDLCASCYDTGATSAQHLTQHPVQCVLARADFDLYYAGEDLNRINLPHSFTCPFCGQMGFSDTTLNAHVRSEHAEESFEVVCPICAATPGGDPNRVTEDFSAHLMLEHRSTGHDLDETQVVMTAAADHQTTTTMHHVVAGGSVRGVGRMHLDAYHYHSPSSTISSLSPSGGHDSETIESMSELLYQLTAIKGRSSTIQSISSQLQQLELQLQTTRHQLEILPLRQSQTASASRQQHQGGGTEESPQVIMLNQGTGPSTTRVQGTTSVSCEQSPDSKGSANKEYLLARLEDTPVSELEQELAEEESADKALFLQELLLTTFVEDLTTKGKVLKQDKALTSLPESLVPRCNLPKPTPGLPVKSTYDRKPLSTAHKEIVAREISVAHGGIVASHQSRERMDLHPPKTRLHPSLKITKHRSGKEPLPPKK